MFQLFIAAAASTSIGPNVPAGFLDAEFRYALSVDDQFEDLSQWGKKLGNWLGTAPSAFSDVNSQATASGLALVARDDVGFRPEGIETDCSCEVQDITTAIVVSETAYQYGLFEIEASMPDASLLSSFWLQGASGEINIADVSNTASSGRTVSHNFHCFEMGTDGSGTTTGGGFNHAAAPFDVDFDPSEFHTYSISWDAAGVTYFIDGAQVGETISAQCLHEEMNVVLSMETIATDLPTPFGSHTMKVKYFKHYTVEAATTTTTTTTTTTQEPALASVCDQSTFLFDAQFNAGDVCASTKPEGKCAKKIKLADAQQRCEAVGGRLCAADEVKAKVATSAAKSQCKVHGKPVWTSTSCTTNSGKRGTLVTRGDGKNARKDACIAAKSTNSKRGALMCCGDASALIGKMTSSRQGDLRLPAADGSSAAGNDSAAAGGSAAVAAALIGVICVVAIIGVIIRRRRHASGTDGGGGDDVDSDDANSSVEAERRASLSSVLSATPPASTMEPPTLIGTVAAFNAAVTTDAPTLKTDNEFVLDATGALRVASVVRGNPMFRNSVHTAAADEIGAAGIDQISAM